MADFSTLESIYTSFTPSDLVGSVTPNLGQEPNLVDSSAFDRLRNIIENNGKGMYSAVSIVAQLKSLTAKSTNGVDLSNFMDFHSTQGFVDSLGKNVDASKAYVGPDGSLQNLSTNPIQQLLGADFKMPSPQVAFDASIFSIRSPFFAPSTRNCHRAEIFLNSMPSTILASMSPFLQVEFMVTRTSAATPTLQAPGLLKFLLGAVPTTSADNPKTPTDAMIGAHQLGDNAGATSTAEVDYAGMEMFTAPQTLFNPLPNQTYPGANAPARYADVIDPTRPFATLEHATISIVPAGAGFYTYKKASLQIKIHDRSRLSEISDLIRPRVYTGVTVWLTYGWRAPTRAAQQNPYFDYINDNMMMREAYGIINSNFSFDNVGQVTLTLELFTKGVREMRESKISDNNNDNTFVLDCARRAGEQLAELYEKMGLDPSGGSAGASGLNRETRASMVLDAAEQGQRPDLTKDQINEAIIQLNDILRHTKSVDQAKVTTLVNTLKQYYSNYSETDPTSKFAINPNSVDQTVTAMFNECVIGADPWLPTLEATIAKSNGMVASQDLAADMSARNTLPKGAQSIKHNDVVSFGKVFSVFAMRNLVSAQTADELQVFFYQMNDQCGPVSGISLSQFPIDMNMFTDQFREHVIRNGGQRLTLEDFLGLLVNAQFLDSRAIGYGMKSAYQPYDPKDPAAKVKDKQGNTPSQLDQWQTKYGTFKQPMIEMYIEVGHQRADEAVGAQSDILQQISHIPTTDQTLTPQQAAALGVKRIMRIHIYDKQSNPYKGAGTFLRNSAGTGYIQINPPANSIVNAATADPDKASAALQQQLQAFNSQTTVTNDPNTGLSKITDPISNQQAKDIVSKMVPTIRFGSNGTTILTAHLASKADPRLSTVQMQRTMTIRNDASPNGTGEYGFPMRVIPAQLQMTTLGNPLATMAQMYFIDFQTGTTLDNLYIVVGLTHTIAPGKFETNWSFGYADAYGVWEGTQQFNKFVGSLSPTVPKGNS